VRLPPGWHDITALASRQLGGLAAREGMVIFGRYAGPSVDGLTPNVLVGRAPLPRLIPVQVFANRILAGLRSRLDAEVSTVRKTEVDGAPAVTFSAQIGTRNTQRQILAKYGYGGFQIIFTAPTAEFQRYLSDFERIIESWRWTA
jgi:hypothetical protein